ncbi:MAG TPA: glycine cleavage system protein GcvH [Deinococcales bacterium]|nr:glycine cleavage system protein GcvH [Deinococcales bacterium]
MELPDNLKYLKSHEWLRQDGDEWTVGITDFAQDQLGDVVFVELPAEGDSVSEGDAIAVVESVKTASDIYTPFAGEITAVNTGLEDAPELLNDEPYEGGWIFRIRPSGTVDEAALLDADAYRQSAEDEA